MLWSTLDRESRQIVCAADDVCRRRPAPCAQAEQGLKRGHRCLAPVMTKDKLVEVDLQLMTADPVVRPNQPLLEIPDGAVSERDYRLGPLAKTGARRLRARHMAIARPGQPRERRQAVGIDRRAGRHILLHEGHFFLPSILEAKNLSKVILCMKSKYSIVLEN